MLRFSKYRLLLILAAAVLFLDQATKLWIAENLFYGAFFPPDAIEVIPGIFNIVHVGNTGAAWSMFSDYTWALTTVGFVVLIAIYFFRKQLELDQPKIQLGYGLIIGGIIGNLVDRIRLGHVIDFLDFHYADHYFPSFNVADSGITVGVVLYIFFSFRSPQNNEEPIPEETDQEPITSEAEPAREEQK